MIWMSPRQAHQFIFLQFQAGLDTNTLEHSNLVLLSEVKLNHVNTKATWL